MTIIARLDDSDDRVKRSEADSPKRKAFLKMEELRKNSSRYYGSSGFDPDQERAEAMKNKYGRFD